MPRRRPPILALALAVSLGACGPAAPDGSSPAATPNPAAARELSAGPIRPPCPMRPCLDGAQITATFGAAEAALGVHTFDVTFGTRSETCTVDFRQVTESASGTCTGDSMLSFGPVTRTVEDTTSVPGAVSVSFVPVPGQFQFRLSLRGNEPEVRVVHRVAGREVLDRRERLTYVEDRPNGPGCDPVCQRVELHWGATDER